MFGNLETVNVAGELGLSHHLEIDAEVRVERRLQSGITCRDVQGVGVVVDFQQLRDVGLLGLSAELHLQVSLLIEAIAEVEGRRYVGDSAYGVDGIAKVLLYKVGTLG